MSETYNKCRVISAGYRYSMYFVFSDLFQDLSNKIAKRFVTVEMKFQNVSYDTRDVFVKDFYKYSNTFVRRCILYFGNVSRILISWNVVTKRRGRLLKFTRGRKKMQRLFEGDNRIKPLQGAQVFHYFFRRFYKLRRHIFLRVHLRLV